MDSRGLTPINKFVCCEFPNLAEVMIEGVLRLEWFSQLFALDHFALPHTRVGFITSFNKLLSALSLDICLCVGEIISSLTISCITRQCLLQMRAYIGKVSWCIEVNKARLHAYFHYILTILIIQIEIWKGWCTADIYSLTFLRWSFIREKQNLLFLTVTKGQRSKR